MIPRYTRPEMARDLGPRDAVSHLVRDRGACRLRHGRPRPDPQGSGQGHLGEGLQGPVRSRAHRCHRARGEARRHRLPHASGRTRRPGSTLRAHGSDLLRRARHLLQRAAGARRRPPHRRYRRLAGRDQEARLRAQADAHHRPQPRHPRRADHLRPEAGPGLRGVHPRQGAHGPRARRGRHLRHIRRRRHVRQHRPAR